MKNLIIGIIALTSTMAFAVDDSSHVCINVTKKALTTDERSQIMEALELQGFIAEKDCIASSQSLTVEKKIEYRLDAPWSWYDGKFHLAQVRCSFSVKLTDQVDNTISFQNKDDSTFWYRSQEKLIACEGALRGALRGLPTKL